MIILNKRYESIYKLKIKADRANIITNTHTVIILNGSPNTFGTVYFLYETFTQKITCITWFTEPLMSYNSQP